MQKQDRRFTVFCKNEKLFRFLCFGMAGIVAVWGGCFFAEHFYALERDSFFGFDTDFLRAFFPWNPRPDMFPGETHTSGLAQLTAYFAFQFFKTGRGALIAVSLICLAFSLVFSASLKRIWKSRFTLYTAPLWAIAYLFFAISLKFPEYFVYALLWAGIFFLGISYIRKPFASLIVAGLTGCCAVWLIGFVATLVSWGFYSTFFVLHYRTYLRKFMLPIYGLFTLCVVLQPLAVSHVQVMKADQIYRSGFMENWHQAGFASQWHLYVCVKKTERLVMEGKYQEALETANPYWFSHPCPIEDLVTGKNTLYLQLSAQQIELRQWLAVYTKLALIGSHRLNEDFFSYYRIPEIYNDLDDTGIPFFSKTKVIYDRLMGNFTGVYSNAMNLMELLGMDYFLLEESIKAALICEQYGLADKYIRLLATSLSYHKLAEIYRQTSAILQRSLSETAVTETEVMQTVAQIREKRALGMTTWMDETGNVYLEAEALWRQNPASLENLEYLSLFDLLYKRLDNVVRNIEPFIALSGQTPPYRLPEAWQEMLFVMMRVMPDSIPPSVFPLIEQMSWDEKVLKQSRLFYQARERYLEGGMTPVEITKRFGHTFAYNYHFRRFVDIWPHSPAAALAH